MRLSSPINNVNKVVRINSYTPLARRRAIRHLQQFVGATTDVRLPYTTEFVPAQTVRPAALADKFPAPAENPAPQLKQSIFSEIDDMTPADVARVREFISTVRMPVAARADVPVVSVEKPGAQPKLTYFCDGKGGPEYPVDLDALERFKAMGLNVTAELTFKLDSDKVRRAEVKLPLPDGFDRELLMVMWSHFSTRRPEPVLLDVSLLARRTWR